MRTPIYSPGQTVTFRSTDSDRAGQSSQEVIVRLLTADEADEEVGPMYLLESGEHAFEDELSEREACDHFQSDGRGCCRNCGHFHGRTEG